MGFQLLTNGQSWKIDVGDGNGYVDTDILKNDKGDIMARDPRDGKYYLYDPNEPVDTQRQSETPNTSYGLNSFVNDLGVGTRNILRGVTDFSDTVLGGAINAGNYLGARALNAFRDKNNQIPYGNIIKGNSGDIIADKIGLPKGNSPWADEIAKSTVSFFTPGGGLKVANKLTDKAVSKGIPSLYKFFADNLGWQTASGATAGIGSGFFGVGSDNKEESNGILPVIGGLVGGALPWVVRGGLQGTGRVLTPVVDQIQNSMASTNPELERIAGRAIKQQLNESVPLNEQPYVLEKLRNAKEIVPGSLPTAADAVGDVDRGALARLERISSSAGNSNLTSLRRLDQQAAQRRLLNQVGDSADARLNRMQTKLNESVPQPTQTSEQIGRNIVREYEAALAEKKKDISNLYSQIDPNQEARFHPEFVQSSIEDALGIGKRVIGKKLPPESQNIYNDISDAAENGRWLLTEDLLSGRSILGKLAAKDGIDPVDRMNLLKMESVLDKVLSGDNALAKAYLKKKNLNISSVEGLPLKSSSSTAPVEEEVVEPLFTEPPQPTKKYLMEQERQARAADIEEFYSDVWQEDLESFQKGRGLNIDWGTKVLGRERVVDLNRKYRGLFKKNGTIPDVNEQASGIYYSGKFQDGIGSGDVDAWLENFADILDLMPKKRDFLNYRAQQRADRPPLEPEQFEEFPYNNMNGESTGNAGLEEWHWYREPSGNWFEKASSAPKKSEKVHKGLTDDDLRIWYEAKRENADMNTRFKNDETVPLQRSSTGLDKMQVPYNEIPGKYFKAGEQGGTGIKTLQAMFPHQQTYLPAQTSNLWSPTWNPARPDAQNWLTVSNKTGELIEPYARNLLNKEAFNDKGNITKKGITNFMKKYETPLQYDALNYPRWMFDVEPTFTSRLHGLAKKAGNVENKRSTFNNILTSVIKDEGVGSRQAYGFKSREIPKRVDLNDSLLKGTFTPQEREGLRAVSDDMQRIERTRQLGNTVNSSTARNLNDFNKIASLANFNSVLTRIPYFGKAFANTATNRSKDIWNMVQDGLLNPEYTLHLLTNAKPQVKTIPTSFKELKQIVKGSHRQGDHPSYQRYGGLLGSINSGLKYRREEKK